LLFLSFIACSTLAFPASPCATAQDNETYLAQDIGILNYALTLEHLEYAFYRDGLNNFTASDFSSNDTYKSLLEIRDHEHSHVQILTSVITSLNGTAVPVCVYEFGYTNASEFLAIARALERTGVSAYSGAINKINRPSLVTAGATIATIEARHAAFLNLIEGFDPFPVAFDVPLSPQQVVSLAGRFIKSCPYNIGVNPLPPLNLTSQTNTTVQAQCSNGLMVANQEYFCTWLYSDSQSHTPLLADHVCSIPEKAVGDVYMFITNSKQTVSIDQDSSVVCGPVVVTVA